MKSYWWVNHNKSFIEENTHGYLWSAKTSKNNTYNQYYMNMRNVHPEDKIISYAKGKIQAIGTVIANAEESKSPYENTNEIGWYVKVSWNNLNTAVDPLLFYKKIKELFPEIYSPLTEDGDGNRNCYLAKISQELFNAIYQKLSEYNVIESSVEPDDIETIINDIDNINLQSIGETEKQQLIYARKGQGLFRESLLNKYKVCMLSGVNIPSVLIASHIKPWKISTNIERLDPDNGLLLSPHFDKLFDRYLISFTDCGELLYSDNLTDVLIKWNILSKKIQFEFSEKTKLYLEYHRNEFRKKTAT